MLFLEQYVPQCNIFFYLGLGREKLCSPIICSENMLAFLSDVDLGLDCAALLLAVDLRLGCPKFCLAKLCSEKVLALDLGLGWSTL